MTPSISLQNIIDAVAAETSVSLEVMRLRTNTVEHANARHHLTMTMVYVFSDLVTDRSIGWFLGGRNAATILHSRGQALTLFEVDHRFRASQMRIFHSLGLSFKWQGMTLEVWKD